MVRSKELRADPDARYGISLRWARLTLVEPALWKAELIGFQGRGIRNTVPGSPWRYEVFVVPSGPFPREPWFEWSSLEADPVYRIEAERQDAFYRINLELGRRLLACELQGYGRRGSMTGPWIPIPAEAWRRLQVPFEPDFRNWSDGRLVGPGMEFWSTRILDRVGLPLKAAALAYGPTQVASVIQRAEAFGIAKPLPTPRPGSLAARARGRAGNVLYDPQPKPTEVGDAWPQLKHALLEALRTGSLVATGEDFAGTINQISPAQLGDRGVDLDHSRLGLPGAWFERVRVRPRDVDPAAASNEDTPAAEISPAIATRAGRVHPKYLRDRQGYSSAKGEAWYVARVARWKAGMPIPSQRQDKKDAETELPGASRDVIRKLRRKHAPAEWQADMPGRKRNAPKVNARE